MLRRSKEVSLTLRGFACSPDDVEELFAVPATKKGNAGAPVKPTTSTRLKRSFVQFSIPLAAETRLDEVIPILIKALGGVEQIESARRKVSPEFLEADITWPIKGSDEQEGGYFSVQSLADLARLECGLSFGFL